ncbi:MAG: di-trans,poly-cis-decaprenylcistransferase [Bacilli bacterium]|nr:di-trans,poly-cis-decaprenylcistransferase [Bacilli bacterium]
MKIPKHVAFILDGNGRWAQERGLSRSKGHEEGYKNLRTLSKYILNKGVKVFSIYAFSTENFGRSKEEVDVLMNLILVGVKKYAKELAEENIKIVFSGIRGYPLPKEIITVMDEVEEKTSNNTRGILNICLNYDGQQEIVDASNKLVEEVNNGTLKLPITKDIFNKYLYQELPPIDLLIRTSAENRLSGFMLWQASYAEFYFPKTYFPDFKEKDFDIALEEYNKRDRRFGKIKED